MENGTRGARVCEDGPDQCSVFFLILEYTHALLKPIYQAGETSLGPDGEEGALCRACLELIPMSVAEVETNLF